MSRFHGFRSETGAVKQHLFRARLRKRRLLMSRAMRRSGLTDGAMLFTDHVNPSIDLSRVNWPSNRVGNGVFLRDL